MNNQHNSIFSINIVTFLGNNESLYLSMFYPNT